MMFAVGCIQAQRCHTNTCPVGVATQDARENFSPSRRPSRGRATGQPPIQEDLVREHDEAFKAPVVDRAGTVVT